MKATQIMIGKRAARFHHRPQVVGVRLDQFLVADEIEWLAFGGAQIAAAGAFLSARAKLVHDELPCPLHQFRVGPNQIRLGDGDVNRGVVRRVIFGIENPRRLLLVARAQAFAFAGRGIEAEINVAPLAQPISALH
jgi:hypothetical protein